MEHVEQIQKKLDENSQALKINRVPKRIKTEFIDLAEQEFCDDYGMTLKFLLDNYKVEEQIEILHSRITELEEKIANLSINTQTEQKVDKQKQIKTLTGKVIRSE